VKFFALFIYRPVATILISLAITLCGILGFRLLPVAPLPQVDFPVIMVSASLPAPRRKPWPRRWPRRWSARWGGLPGSTMTSSSSLGSTRIILEFNFDRDINGAARDVQAAINAAQSLLPSGMPSRPTYRKANPSDAPIMILTLTSDTYSRVSCTISPPPSWRRPSRRLTASAMSTSAAAPARGARRPQPAGAVQPGRVAGRGAHRHQQRQRAQTAGGAGGQRHRWQVQTNDELKTAAEYQPLIVHYNNGAAVRLGDVATVTDSVQDVRNAGMTNAKPAILLMIRKLPEANIIQTVDSIRARLPELQQTIPAAIDLQIAQDRSPTIRASLEEVEQTLVISVALVILVVFLFLRSGARR
jgi:multidrug efflux pump